jgi:transposase InsO family protein
MLKDPNQGWSMDFVADALFDGRRFRALTVVDNFTKESLAIEVNQHLKGEDVVAMMERLRHQRELPQRIQTDRQRQRIRIDRDGSLGLRQWGDYGLFPTWHTDRQPLHRVVQWQLPGRVSQHALVPVAR